MIEKLPSLSNLLKQLQKVPYLASRDLNRVANYFMQLSESEIKHFCDVLTKSSKNLKLCQICFAWKEIEQDCIFCCSPKRDNSIICVVETWHDLLAIEKTSGYRGVYHVLKGALCPLDGIGPSDLTIKQLIERAQQAKEIIFATNQTPEGEATAAYIAKKLENVEIKLSCLARGLPIGSSLGSMDRLTVYKALSERRPF